jgi:hypothetical protein
MSESGLGARDRIAVVDEDPFQAAATCSVKRGAVMLTKAHAECRKTRLAERIADSGPDASQQTISLLTAYGHRKTLTAAASVAAKIAAAEIAGGQCDRSCHARSS